MQAVVASKRLQRETCRMGRMLLREREAAQHQARLDRLALAHRWELNEKALRTALLRHVDLLASARHEAEERGRAEAEARGAAGRAEEARQEAQELLRRTQGHATAQQEKNSKVKYVCVGGCSSCPGSSSTGYRGTGPVG